MTSGSTGWPSRAIGLIRSLQTTVSSRRADGLLDQVDAAGAAQLARLGQVAPAPTCSSSAGSRWSAAAPSNRTSERTPMTASRSGSGVALATIGGSATARSGRPRSASGPSSGRARPSGSPADRVSRSARKPIARRDRRARVVAASARRSSLGEPRRRARAVLGLGQPCVARVDARSASGCVARHVRGRLIASSRLARAASGTISTTWSGLPASRTSAAVRSPSSPTTRVESDSVTAWVGASSCRRGTSTTLPSRNRPRRGSTSTCSMSDHGRPCQVRPRRSRTPCSSTTSSGTRRVEQRLEVRGRDGADDGRQRPVEPPPPPPMARVEVGDGDDRGDRRRPRRRGGRRCGPRPVPCCSSVCSSIRLVTSPPGGSRSRHRSRRA